MRAAGYSAWVDGDGGHWHSVRRAITRVSYGTLRSRDVTVTLRQPCGDRRASPRYFHEGKQPNMTTQRAGHAQQARAQSPRPVDATSGWRVDRADEQGLRQRLTGAADERLAKGLGWFSIALGLTQLLAPDGMARLIGVRPTGTTRSAQIASAG